MQNRFQLSGSSGSVALWACLCVFIIGCAGSLGREGQRTTNAEVTVISFGSVQGEILECG